MRNKFCIICKYSKLDLVASKVRDSAKHKIIKCKKCGHVQLYPIPTQQDDNKFYDENMQDKNVNDVGSIKRAKRKMMEDTIRRVNLIRKLTPKKGKILEIGSGHGFFLEMMRKCGYKMTGIEISKEKRKFSKQVTDVKVLNVNINEELPYVGNFDVIVMFQVLEHIIDPIGFLRNVRKLLKSNGKIIIEVPNCDDFQLRLHKEYREFYWQRAHISYFTPITLKRIFSKVDFNTKILGTQRYSIENMFGWKLLKKPQMENPTYNLPEDYEWVEKFYKHHLEKNLICDTLIAIGT